MKTLRLILGDQLNQAISSLADCDKANDIIFMCEVSGEATAVKHHQQKLVFVFSAMRHFAKELRAKGHHVDYVTLDGQFATFSEALTAALTRHRVDKVVVTMPSEYRVLQEVNSWKNTLSVPLEIRDDDRFLCEREMFAQWASSRKSLRMEYFYRELRKRYEILMEAGEPIGGRWNFDSENRKPGNAELKVPRPHRVKPDPMTQEVMHLVSEQFSTHFGDIDDFHYAVTRRQALNVLQRFIDERLTCFGDYQDAMLQEQPWMYHAHIGLYLNIGLLLPLECIRGAEQAYYAGQAPLPAVEGFIRQILGWREYVRGIYWYKMPKYAHMNYLQAKRKLPDLYWHGQTKMNCLKQCVKTTAQHAYAHHIQRLMVLGNFALLIGADPVEVNEWYLIVYADAYEWVEMPNVSGMTLFADGGLLASKPYAASGAYINRMSNYCQHCPYQVSKKLGDNACPFNYLYWDFLMRNEQRLSRNPRMGMPYKNLARMDESKRAAIRAQAQQFLDELT